MRIGLIIAAALTTVACGSQPDPPPPPAARVTGSVEAAAPSSPAPSVGCSAEETTIFACTMPSGKRLAVCSAGDSSATYRFGGGTPELELTGGRWARVGYSGGGELQIAFDNGGTRYVVFGRTIRTGFDERGNNPVSSDGVIILRDGRFVGMQLCDPASDPYAYGEESEAALQRLPQSEELFTEETMRADPPGDE